MGKKSSSKFVNPTDKARKDARKKELKKNKKQRLAVREAVIKSKDPHRILADLERLDQLQFNVGQQPTMNEKVLLEKRRKLKETWDRVMRMYHKEDKTKWIQFKRMEDEYEVKRCEMQRHFEAVKSAENVSIEEIPLPPCLSEMIGPAGPRRVAPSLVTHRITVSRPPPGPPPGLPPDLTELDDDPTEKLKQKNEEDVDEFLKEIEQVVPRQMPVPIPPIISPLIPLPSSSLANPVTPLAASLPRINPPLSAGPARPMFISDQHKQSDATRKSTSFKAPSEAVTIEAKPQLRNLSADSTRFLPTSLKIKRHDQKLPRRTILPQVNPAPNSRSVTSDDAYQEFMKEMKGLL